MNFSFEVGLNYNTQVFSYSYLHTIARRASSKVLHIGKVDFMHVVIRMRNVHNMTLILLVLNLLVSFHLIRYVDRGCLNLIATPGNHP